MSHWKSSINDEWNLIVGFLEIRRRHKQNTYDVIGNFNVKLLHDVASWGLIFQSTESNTFRHFSTKAVRYYAYWTELIDNPPAAHPSRGKRLMSNSVLTTLGAFGQMSMCTMYREAFRSPKGGARTLRETVSHVFLFRQWLHIHNAGQRLHTTRCGSLL